jgi:hypothetical protein
MDKHNTLAQLIDKMIIVVQTPITHSYSLAELVQDELQNEDIDLQ